MNKTKIVMKFPFSPNRPSLVLDRLAVILLEISGTIPEFDVPDSIWEANRKAFGGPDDAADQFEVQTVAGVVTFTRVP